MKFIAELDSALTGWLSPSTLLLMFIGVVIVVVLVNRKGGMNTGSTTYTPRPVTTPCQVEGCGRESETECDSCAKDICSSHGSYYGGGGELHFLCDPCFARNQASSNPGRFVHYGSRANADRYFSEDD